MSSDTKQALDDAIAAHVADEADGALITGYVLHAAYINPDLDGREATGYYAEYATSQPYHVGLGLAHQMVNHFDEIWYDDDDE